MPLMPAPRRVCLKPPEPEEPAAGSSGGLKAMDFNIDLHFRVG